MVQNFFVFMLTGVVIGLMLFGLWRLIRHFIRKHKEKKQIENDDNNIILK